MRDPGKEPRGKERMDGLRGAWFKRAEEVGEGRPGGTFRACVLDETWADFRGMRLGVMARCR